MIGLYQNISIMNISITGKDLYIMVNFAHIPSRRIEIQRRHALSMKALPSLMEFLGKETQKYPSIPTRINDVSPRSGMECGISFPFQTHAINIRNGIFLYISLDLPWTK